VIVFAAAVAGQARTKLPTLDEPFEVLLSGRLALCVIHMFYYTFSYVNVNNKKTGRDFSQPVHTEVYS